MNAGPPTALPPDQPVSKADDAAAIRERMQRIKEDIDAAEEKVRRIETRIQRDRRALALWQTRLAGLPDEQRPA